MKKKNIYNMSYSERSMYECEKENKSTKWRNGIASVLVVAAFVMMICAASTGDYLAQTEKDKTETQKSNKNIVNMLGGGVACLIGAGIVAKKSR